MASVSFERQYKVAEVLDAPTNDEIAVRAYELYLDRGAADGADLDDWLNAERELLHRRAAALADDSGPVAHDSEVAHV